MGALNITGAGEAYVYRYDDAANPPTWNLEATLQAQLKRVGGHFAMSLAIDGDNLAVGSPHDDLWLSRDPILNCGSVTMFQYDGTGGWPRIQTIYANGVLSANDQFGTDVALDGDKLVVGCPLDDIDGADSGLAQLFTYTLGANPWAFVTTFRASDAAAGDQFGSSVAIENGRVVIGSKNDDEKGTDSGSAYLFSQISGEWLELAKLAAENGQNGDHLGGGKAALSAGLAMFGAPDRGDLSQAGAGAVHTFDVTDANGNNAPDPCDEAFSYDADGNLTQDANFNYTWDGENRLVGAEPRDESSGALRVTYTYDYKGRRVRRLVEQSDGQAWSPIVDTRYLYDGWNCVAEFYGLGGGGIRKRYTWGLDLSGTLQGAGGVGGLLACEDVGPTTETSDNVSYLYEYDANGNVMALVDSTDGDVLARYDYDPYGSAIAFLGSVTQFVDTNPYRFSTKPLDDVTGLYYYGYRYYSPKLGRWVSRDPIGEMGEVNLHSMVGNAPVSRFDFLGLQTPRRLNATAPRNIGVHKGLYKVCDRECECRCKCTKDSATSQDDSESCKEDCLTQCRKDALTVVREIKKMMKAMRATRAAAGQLTPNCTISSYRLTWQLSHHELDYFECDAVNLAQPAGSSGAHVVVGCRPKSCAVKKHKLTDGDEPSRAREDWDIFIDLTAWNTNFAAPSGLRFYCFSGDGSVVTSPSTSHTGATYVACGGARYNGHPLRPGECCPEGTFFGCYGKQFHETDDNDEEDAP